MKKLTRIPEEIIETLNLKSQPSQMGKSFMNDCRIYEYDYSGDIKVTFCECDFEGNYLTEGYMMLYFGGKGKIKHFELPVNEFKDDSKQEWDDFIKNKIESNN